MLKMFNYNKRDDAFNDIIDEAVAFAAAELTNFKTIGEAALLTFFNIA